MALTIQRVPRGIAELLSIFGGRAPTELAQLVNGCIDLTQFYGLTQWQIRANSNPALAEGSTIALNVPPEEWWVVYSVTGLIAKTATMTALSTSLLIGPDPGSLSAVASKDDTTFGATLAGASRIVWYAPYPRLVPPGSRISFALDILGTDATANCSLTASLGVLG